MDTNNEILDAIEILTNKKIGENITKILTGICKSVNINNNTCVMDSNGVIGTVQFYGSPPEVNELYRIFVPSNNMSRSFIVVPPKFTVNPNLLDNWYFMVPVNQRGQTEYSNSANGATYSIDRWLMNWYTGKITLSDNGVFFNSVDSTAAIFRQKICTKDDYKYFVGKQFTISALINGELSVCTGVLPPEYASNAGFDSRDSTDKGKRYFIRLICQDNRLNFDIYINAGDPIEFPISACKLELGPTQTLAHLENGNWVLNEIPDYGEQLRKCQRYYYQVHYVQYQTINMAYEDIAYAFLMLPLPVEMRLKYPVMTQSTPILLGTSEKTLVSAEVSGCMARLGLNYDAITNPSRSCYSYCPDVGGVTFTFSADL